VLYKSLHSVTGTILVADDHAANRELLEELLRMRGFKVVTVDFDLCEVRVRERGVQESSAREKRGSARLRWRGYESLYFVPSRAVPATGCIRRTRSARPRSRNPDHPALNAGPTPSCRHRIDFNPAQEAKFLAYALRARPPYRAGQTLRALQTKRPLTIILGAVEQVVRPRTEAISEL
jgi:hypothetical protein